MRTGAKSADGYGMHSFSGTRFAGVYFTGQAGAIGAWRLVLAGVPTSRRHFLPTLLVPGRAPVHTARARS